MSGMNLSLAQIAAWLPGATQVGDGEQRVTQPFGSAINVAVQTAWRIASILRRFTSCLRPSQHLADKRPKIRLNFHCSDKIVKRPARVWGTFQTVS